MNAKTCKQCGELKPIEQYRKYYGGRKGSYNTCKLCEKINARAKYLKAKGDSITFEEGEELDKIYTLYEAQRATGLRPPGEVERKKPLVDSLDDMIAKYNHNRHEVVRGADDVICGPPEINKWLTCELTEEPDYYLDEVYEELKAKYRPQVHIDQNTLQPIYDDTHKDSLEKVLDRFYKYEEDYWNEDDDK